MNRKILHAIGLPFALVVIWWALTRGETSFFVPTPEALWQAWGETWTLARWRNDVLPSVWRLLQGLGLAIAVGGMLGIWVGSHETLRLMLEPVLEFLRALPAPILVPVMMLFLGINDEMKVLVIAFGTVWPILLNTIEGVRGIDPVLKDTARTNHIDGWHRLVSLTLPAASPQIMAGIRQSLALALILMVISEMFAATSGLGFAIIQFQRNFAIPAMWTGIVILGALGIGMTFAFSVLERRLLHWYYGMRVNQGDR